MLAGLGKIKGASLGSSGSARFSGFREFLPGRRTAAGGAAPKEPKIFCVSNSTYQTGRICRYTLKILPGESDGFLTTGNCRQRNAKGDGKHD